MDYRIIADSCLDLTPEMKEEGKIQIVPLILQVDGVDFIDDASFDQKKFIKAVADFEGCPKSSCPSPEDYKKAFGEDEIPAFCVTLSAELSGSYNSAVLGQRLVQEEFPNKKVHIFNSRSASAGETLIAMKVQELAESGMDFEEVVEKTEEFIRHQDTMFVLENLDTLRKNGRLSGMKATLVSVLNIKPVMMATPEGTIEQCSLGRGTKKALKKMVEEVGKKVSDMEQKIFAISHCNCPERAAFVQEEVKRLYSFKKIVIADTAGVSTMYANDGGIVISF
ncbi:DegV family protein [Frisingicoccus sp.]|uniref:DegV family protein n=1 Tax=Frisingicoccus sp. TaxID=1918627 RepID=UPI0015BD01C6|nr:DegV family protein [Frisingicoccus sp.]MEE0751991.1 DegV family protein [Frisingicoccus sp.]